MPPLTSEFPPKSTIRFAGLLYLTIIIFGIGSEVLIRSALIVPGDATATAGNILANDMLFRLGFAADTIMTMADVALAVLLFGLFRQVSANLSLMAMVFRLMQAAILGMNLLNHHAALLILNRPGAGGVFDAGQLGELALMSLDVHGHGYDLGLIFFGVNSLLTGTLLVKASFAPRPLGYMMMGAGAVYLAGSYIRFLCPAALDAFSPAYIIPVMAELALCLWLLTRAGAMHRALAQGAP